MIEVTSADIFAGARRSPTRCPIALAMNRAYSASDAFVDHVIGSIGERWFPLPDRACLFIRDFDRGRGPWLKPFSFEEDFSQGGKILWHSQP